MGRDEKEVIISPSDCEWCASCCVTASSSYSDSVLGAWETRNVVLERLRLLLLLLLSMNCYFLVVTHRMNFPSANSSGGFVIEQSVELFAKEINDVTFFLNK